MSYYCRIKLVKLHVKLVLQEHTTQLLVVHPAQLVPSVRLERTVRVKHRQVRLRVQPVIQENIHLQRDPVAVTVRAHSHAVLTSEFIASTFIAF